MEILHMVRNTGRSAKSTVDAEEVTDVPEVMGEERVAEVMRTRTFKDDALSAIDSWDKAAAMAQAAYGKISAIEDVLGNGFMVIRSDETKKTLVGAPLLLLEWQYNNGDFNEFVSVYAIRKKDSGAIDKYVLNGGEAIANQLRQVEEETGINGGLYVAKGLRVSEFNFCDTKDCEDYGRALNKQQEREHITAGKEAKPAKTWYLDISA
jgi:hypothetical protein